VGKIKGSYYGKGSTKNEADLPTTKTIYNYSIQLIKCGIKK